jgi:hypothetical protein
MSSCKCEESLSRATATALVPSHCGMRSMASSHSWTNPCLRAHLSLADGNICCFLVVTFATSLHFHHLYLTLSTFTSHSITSIQTSTSPQHTHWHELTHEPIQGHCGKYRKIYPLACTSCHLPLNFTYATCTLLLPLLLYFPLHFTFDCLNFTSLNLTTSYHSPSW